ncbi:MAG: tellurite resistance TerB family protein [Alphaproteobacteria bacterium]
MAIHHEGLIYIMVMAAAADREMKDEELMRLGDIVRSLPVFRDFDENDIPKIAAACANLLNDEDGLDEALEFVREALPEKLRETAYAISCDVVAADGAASQEELRLLEMIRHDLDIDRLAAAGIERGARARHMVA